MYSKHYIRLVAQQLLIGRSMSTVSGVPSYSRKVRPVSKMRGWQIHSYGSLDEVQYSESLKMPMLTSPNQLLVKITASSVNPIDVAMIKGYGASVLNTLRCSSQIEFPLTVGRDFCGEIVQKGLGVSSRDLDIGDEVWGVVPVHQQGCHADYVVVERYCLSKKPENLRKIDSSAVLYAGLTAWSGLYITGHLGGVLGAISPVGGGRGKKVLVLGSAGGVGTLAVQILLAEGVEVYATCSSDAVESIQNLGVPYVIDYNDPTHVEKLATAGKFDIILDCAGKGTEYATEVPWKFEQYITFNSPVLKNIDDHGFATGMYQNTMSIVRNNVVSANAQKGLVKWGYFVPAPQGVAYLQKLIEKGKLLPVIEKIFSFEQVLEAYARVEAKHLRGKIVIDYN
ncbi:reticulon-4-interacting protein 1 homolog, mitochondrial [Malaya genurostris]|uniref:reticulon-4-interacting protein 1 homolog, mitochondrial n=1 Tax=Malaya genurostris TaxID=325434 RepID=UPI0026F3F4BC|nr:reticulon-4-interacting protein 1 homolog, mitochondrial [Malaya genurostris]